MRAFLHRYFYPHTLEQGLGIGYLVMAISLIPRPFLAGIENLYIYYGVTPLAPRAVGVLLALCALVLICYRALRHQYIGRRLFGFLLVPIPLYTVCLGFYFKDHLMVGLAGTIGYVGLTICLRTMYRERATEREREQARLRQDAP